MASAFTVQAIESCGAPLLFGRNDRAIARRAQRRFAASLALATLLLGSLLILRIDWRQSSTVERRQEPIAVHLKPPAAADAEVPTPESIAEPRGEDAGPAHDLVEKPSTTAADDTAASTREAPPGPIDVQNETGVDWAAELRREARAAATAERPEDDVFYFANNRRERAEAAVKYAPVPPPKRIWDNVEKDIYGRTILRSGNCYRVLDDPRATNRWAFETFEQFMVYCDPVAKGPKKLPWVETIREMYGMDAEE